MPGFTREAMIRFTGHESALDAGAERLIEETHQQTQHADGVCGGGVLGGQIAWHSAFKGKSVTVQDISQASIDKGRDAHRAYAGVYEDEIAASRASVESAQGRVSYTTDLAEAVAGADIVIESVPEVPEIKPDLHEKLSEVLREEAIIATNTSTLLPSMFAEARGVPIDPARCTLPTGPGT
jgi:3-hydroxybutyryl-CoA dehydrogenase